MKILLTLFVLLFSFSLVAEDISDFQIEGISVGDSLLDYLSEDYIKSEIERTEPWYAYLSDNSRFGEVYKYDNNKKYFLASFFVKRDDNEYVIQGIRGIMPHEPNMEQCQKQMDQISKEFSVLYKNTKKNESSWNHPIDTTGRSKVRSIDYIFDNGDEISLTCIDFEEKLRIENSWIDGLDISLSNKELSNWLRGH